MGFALPAGPAAGLGAVVITLTLWIGLETNGEAPSTLSLPAVGKTVVRVSFVTSSIFDSSTRTIFPFNFLT